MRYQKSPGCASWSVILVLLTIPLASGEPMAFDIAAAKRVAVVDARSGLDLDAYGGSRTLRGQPTGWFSLQRIRDRWWLVTPEGNGMVSLGVVHVLQAKEQPIFQGAYGGDAQACLADALDNLRRWGFNSLGYGGINKRSTAAMVAAAPPFVLSMEDLLGVSRFSARPERIDLFDEAARRLLAGRIAENIAPVKEAKHLIGYFYVDVPLWWNLTMRAKGVDWACAYRKLPATAPGKAVYVDFLLGRQVSAESFRAAYGVAAADRAALLAETAWERVDLDAPAIRADDLAFVAVVARQYYRLCHEELRRQDPHHLIFGDRFASVDLRDLGEVLRAAAPYVDGIAIQPFDKGGFEAAVYDQAAGITGRPLLICDFATNCATPTHPRGMWQTHPTEDAAADAYARYLEAAFSRPYLVGMHRCTYIDRPRDEVLKQGLVRQDGTPYLRMVQRHAEIHRDLYGRLYRGAP